jgi:hypothetical protein
VRALLRQPHGFEGFGVIQEELLVDDPACAHHKDVRDLQAHLRALACNTPGVPHGNSVAGVDEVADRFHYIGVPGFADFRISRIATVNYNPSGAGLRGASLLG